jgi:hypothetical protein
MRTATVILIAATILLLGSVASADVYTFRTYHELKVNKDFKLHVTNTAGLISIQRSDTDALVIDAEKKISAGSKSKAERLDSELEIAVDADRNRVEIETHYPKWNTGDSFWEKILDLRKDSFGYVNYYIKVPTDVHLSVSTTSGSILITDLKGRIDISVTSGDAQISDCVADVSVSTTSGDVKLVGIDGRTDLRSTSSDALIENINGNVSIRSTSGTTEIYGITGNIEISKTSGHTKLIDVAGNIKLSSTSGNIEVSQDKGSILIDSYSGDVHIDTQLNSGSRYTVETTSGSILFSMPIGSNGRVRIESVSGEVDTSVPVRVESVSRRQLTGEIGFGGPRIELSSTSGDITVSEF